MRNGLVPLILVLGLATTRPALALEPPFAVQLGGEYLVDLAGETYDNWGNSAGGSVKFVYRSHPRVHITVAVHYGQRPFESIFFASIPEDVTLSIDGEDSRCYGASLGYRFMDSRELARARGFAFVRLGLLHTRGGKITRTYMDTQQGPDFIYISVLRDRKDWFEGFASFGFGVTVRAWGETRVIGSLGVLSASDRNGASFPFSLGLEFPIGARGGRAPN